MRRAKNPIACPVLVGVDLSPGEAVVENPQRVIGAVRGNIVAAAPRSKQRLIPTTTSTQKAATASTITSQPPPAIKPDPTIAPAPLLDDRVRVWSPDPTPRTGF